MRKVLHILITLIASVSILHAQKAVVSGTIQSAAGVPAGQNSYVEFTLVNCGNNQAVVNGIAVMLNQPVDFPWM